MKKYFKTQVFSSRFVLSALLILSTGQTAMAANDAGSATPSNYLGHRVYFQVVGNDIAAATRDASRSLELMMQKDKAQAATVHTSSATKLEALKKAQTELSTLQNQLGKSLLRQDATILVAISGATLFGTSIMGRIGMESAEKLIGAVELAVPNVTGLGAVNNLLTKTKALLDRVGKFAGKTTMISGVIGTSATAYIFYCQYEDVQRLATEVDRSLADVETMIAQIKFVESAPAK